jgi:hypothetical protein
MMVHKRIKPTRDGRLPHRISVATGLLVTVACGANEPFTDLFPETDGGLDATVGTVEAPSSASDSRAWVGDAGSEAATSAVPSAPSHLAPNSSGTFGGTSDSDGAEQTSDAAASATAETDFTGVTTAIESASDAGPTGELTEVFTLAPTTSASTATVDDSGTPSDVSTSSLAVPDSEASTSHVVSSGSLTDWSLPLGSDDAGDNDAGTRDGGNNDAGPDDAGPDGAILDTEPGATDEESSNSSVLTVSSDVSTSETNDATDQSTTEGDVTGEPTACGNGVFEEGEACCSSSVITSELDARSLATEAALESAVACAPTQNGSTNSGWPRLSYSLCSSGCENGGRGCDTMLANTTVIYDPSTNTVSGFADVTLTGELQWANAYWTGSCDLVVTLSGVEFTADVTWADDPAEIEIRVTNLNIDVNDTAISGCTPARPASRAVADADLAALVRPALDAGLTQEFAGELTCPY